MNLLPALPTVDTMQHNANYHRRKKRPRHPQDLDFDIQDKHVAEDFMRCDLRVDGERHLIFATDILLILSQAKTWYIDATFHIVQRPFYQLFTINVFVRQEDSLKHLPMIQVVMSRRLFSRLAGSERSAATSPTHPTDCDGFWRCSMASGMWRHVWPAQHIEPMFRRLQDEAMTEPLIQFADYVNRTWMSCAQTIRTPDSWSVYRLSIRTNNDIEGWHNRLKSRGSAHMPF